MRDIAYMRSNTVLTLLGLALCVSAQRFVRFISTDGKEYTGDAILPAGDFDAAHSKQAHVIEGDILGDFTVTNQVKVRATSYGGGLGCRVLTACV